MKANKFFLAAQGFRQFCKVADMFVKVPDVIYFERRKAPFEPLKRELPRGAWGHALPGKFEERTLRNVVSSVSGNQVSVSQARLEQKFSLKSNIFNENGQMVGDRGGGDSDNRIFSCL